MDIDLLNAQLHLLPDSASAGGASASAAPSPGMSGMSAPQRAMLKEILRPIIDEILREELDLQRRVQGG